jgi:hypothetical protein
MSIVERVVDAPPNRIRDVLADGWNYADWVVGAVHIRAVDPNWPSPGSRVHHRIGAWPLTLEDSTETTAWDPNGRMRLRARLWPLGEATVELTWQDAGGGRTRVRMAETLTAGPAQALRNRVGDVLMDARNTESLARLEHLTGKIPN